MRSLSGTVISVMQCVCVCVCPCVCVCVCVRARGALSVHSMLGANVSWSVSWRRPGKALAAQSANHGADFAYDFSDASLPRRTAPGRPGGR